MPEQSPDDPRTTSKILGIAETLFLLGAFAIIAGWLAPKLGLPTRAVRDAFLYEGAPRWLDAAKAEAIWLTFRFGLTLFAAWLICFWRGGPTRREASLSTGGQNVFKLIGFGLATCLVILAPFEVVTAIHMVSPLGDNTPFWDLSRRSEWTLDFWIYMAASSYLLVPIFEELLFRSYILGRYRENFSAGGAIVLTSIIFWVSHGQYLGGDPFLFFNSLYLLFGALVMGWITLHTGSVIPALSAHMLLNIPGGVPYRIAFAVVGFTILIAYWRTVVRLAGEFIRSIASTKEWLFLILAGAAVFGLITLVRSDQRALLPAAIAVAVLFVLDLARRRKKAGSVSDDNAISTEAT